MQARFVTESHRASLPPVPAVVPIFGWERATEVHVDCKPTLLDECRPDYIRAVPTINLTDDELAAVTAAIRRAIQDDRFPHAPRLDPLRAALARLDAATANREPHPKAPPAAKGDKRARSAKATPEISPGFKLGRLPPDR